MNVSSKRKVLYRKVLQLRRSGRSYNQISKKLKIAKSTLSDWLMDKRWSRRIKLKLTDKTRIRNSDHLIKINKLKHIYALRRHEEYRLKARLAYSKLKQNKLFLAGLAIYWGEGDKTDIGRVSLVNSDSRMLQVIISFYRKVLKVREEKLRAALFIYDDIKEKKAINYWSKTLRISKKNFIKTQVLPSRSKLTKNKVPNGMCCIYFSNKELSVKIREWISMLYDDMRW